MTQLSAEWETAFPPHVGLSVPLVGSPGPSSGRHHACSRGESARPQVDPNPLRARGGSYNSGAGPLGCRRMWRAQRPDKRHPNTVCGRGGCQDLRIRAEDVGRPGCGVAETVGVCNDDVS